MSSDDKEVKVVVTSHAQSIRAVAALQMASVAVVESPDSVAKDKIGLLRLTHSRNEYDLGALDYIGSLRESPSANHPWYQRGRHGQQLRY
ncbi:uncharacterized protein NMK_2031 [Novimethylophilus kurashikiensis]|uniref:Uncharacterized protein n=1 Tax=Novimethylophilus kurashikiensis TaxID=1825523 RepID=A0A2R5F864_9PROT|nr:uncharacterized protein NMK_2031 [Novimethylophilus kurashikiensis]